MHLFLIFDNDRRGAFFDKIISNSVMLLLTSLTRNVYHCTARKLSHLDGYSSFETMKALSHTSHEEKNLCFWYIECSKSFRHPLYWEWSTYVLYLTCAKVVYYKCITLQKGIDEVFGNINIGYLKENTSLFHWLMCWHWEYSASRYNYITGHKSHSKPPVMPSF